MANGDAISPREEIVAGEVGNEASWSGSRIHSIFFASNFDDIQDKNFQNFRERLFQPCW
jgi:hypothetical protein